ncbi:hypothetical protein KAR28_04345 [Candidatus Parcubacteria bacterium]|nr:hypothetical protein [Candidatus Parcubacteria bacterium]
MSFTEVGQMGIGFATLFILLLVVKYFISAIQKKDDYIKELTEDYYKKVDNIVAKYYTTVNNYIKEGEQTRQDHIKALQELTLTIRGLK